MKRYISILCAVLPLFAFAQTNLTPKWTEADKLSIGFNLGTVYDIDFSRLDKDAWSTDMSSDMSDDPCFAHLFSLNYQATPSLSVGANFGKGTICGKNDIVYYDGKFTQYNITTKLDILRFTPELTLYGRIGAGIIAYTASRSFIADDVTYLEEEGESIKTNMAMGLQYTINDRWAVVADASYDRVANDGFDSWDDGTGNDKFLYTSLGVNYTLGKKKEDNREEEIKKLIEELNTPKKDDCKDCKEIENMLDKMDKRIAELEALKQEVENTDFAAANNITEQLKGRLFFAKNSTEINVTAQPSLKDLVVLLNKYPSWTASIVGYTDSDASEEYNLQLSEDRATAVLDYLVELGADKAKLSTAFKGETSPFEPNDSEDGKQLNRRVEIIIKK